MSERTFIMIAILTLLFSVTMFLFPQIDLAVSSFFYRPASGFFFQTYYELLHINFYRDILIWISYGFIAFIILILIIALFNKQKKILLTPKACIFLLICFLLGPVLVVNETLKNHWGRARPHQVQQFGGKKIFTPAWVVSNQCNKNCSFTSGETANVFYYLALIFVIGRKRVIAIVIMSIGFITALERIGQGDHFLSDAILSGLIDYLLIWVIYRTMGFNNNQNRSIAK